MDKNFLKRVAVETLQQHLPNLLAVYLFGSQITDSATLDSDLDVAVLVEGYVEPLMLWALAGELAERADCPVDLLDLRAASTVMQYQIITTGECSWMRDSSVQLFEAAILSDKTELNVSRAALLNDIAKRGSIYDR